MLIQSRRLDTPEMEVPLPTSPEWITAARIQGFSVVTPTTIPLAAPDLDVIDAHVAAASPGTLWHAHVKVLNR